MVEISKDVLIIPILASTVTGMLLWVITFCLLADDKSGAAAASLLGAIVQTVIACSIILGVAFAR